LSPSHDVSHVEKLLLEEIKARRELGEVVARLAQELESSQGEAARQRDAAEQARQTEAAVSTGLRDRLRVLETELVEARASRAALEKEVSESSPSTVAHVLDGMKRELATERALREKQAEELKASQSYARQLSAQLSALSEKVERIHQTHQEDLKEVEGALGREKQRQGEWHQQSMETKGKVDGLSGALEQRVQALSGDIDILKNAVARSEEARAQAVDTVAQAKRELATVVDEAAQQAVKHHLVASDLQRRQPAEAEGASRGEWRVRILEEQLEAKLGGISQRMGVMEGVLAEERHMRREHFDEGIAEARRQTEALRSSTAAMVESSNAAVNQAKLEMHRKIRELKAELEQTSDSLRHAGRELSKSSVEGMRNLHVTINQLQGSQGTKLLELEQVLSAEIQARRGSSQALNSSIQAVQEQGQTHLMLRIANLEKLVQAAQVNAKEARTSSTTALDLSSQTATHVSNINEELARQKRQLEQQSVASHREEHPPHAPRWDGRPIVVGHGSDVLTAVPLSCVA